MTIMKAGVIALLRILWDSDKNLLIKGVHECMSKGVPSKMIHYRQGEQNIVGVMYCL